jgi:hypothetical protein
LQNVRNRRFLHEGAFRVPTFVGSCVRSPTVREGDLHLGLVAGIADSHMLRFWSLALAHARASDTFTAVREGKIQRANLPFVARSYD